MEKTVNIWLCPVKPKSFRIIKTFKVFGLPKRAANIAKQIQIHDLIIFHILRPINGIVAVCEVVSGVYENHHDIWGKNRYPLRLKVEFIPDLIRHEKEPIHLSQLFYDTKSSDDIIIEPYMQGIYITRITPEQFEKLKAFFKQKQRRQKNEKNRKVLGY